VRAEPRVGYDSRVTCLFRPLALGVLVAAVAACGPAANGSDSADGTGDGDASPMDAGPRLDRGAACERDEDCASGVCVQSPGLAQVCSVACRRDGECGTPDTGVACAVDHAPGAVRLVCALVASAVAYPTEPCQAHEECTTNLCVDALCRNACDRDADCAAGWRCGDTPVDGAVVRACRADPITGPVVETYTLFDGERGVGMRTDEIPVMAPPDVVSLAFTVQDVGGTSLAASVTFLSAPDQAHWIDSRTWTVVRDQPVREIFGIPEINTALVPSSNTLAVLSGRYMVASTLQNRRDVTMETTGRMRTTVRIKRAPGGLFERGTLHVRVHFVGLDGLDAESAASNERLRAGLESVADILAQADVTLVVDGYADVPPPDAARYAVIDSRAELDELLTHSTGSQGDVVNLFYVRGIAASEGLENAIGVAGDIVGPPGIHGTTNSGVVIGWETTLNVAGVDVVGRTTAHEISHYLGLWHVRERLAPCTMAGETNCGLFGAVDPITDTPTDDTAVTYLMNWFTNGTNRRLSPGQSRVLRASPLVRPE
jgi:hypothetical protein